jgi:putative ABC transport system ATP-binding protein
MGEVLIKVSNLNKIYSSSSQENHVLRDINLVINKGDFTVVMGSSGAGKSTLLYTLCGLDSITSGEIVFDGFETKQMNERRWSLLRRNYIGFIHQTYNLIPNLSIQDNIIFPALLNSNKINDIKKKARELMEKLGILEIATSLPSQVSGGEQQRAAIARALVKSPAVIFADEPTGSLNSENGKHILDILTQINNENKQSIIMVTHDIKAATRANRIMYICDGKIKEDIKMIYKYDKKDELKREEEIFQWLKKQGW